MQVVPRVRLRCHHAQVSLLIDAPSATSLSEKLDPCRADDTYLRLTRSQHCSGVKLRVRADIDASTPRHSILVRCLLMATLVMTAGRTAAVQGRGGCPLAPARLPALAGRRQQRCVSLWPQHAHICDKLHLHLAGWSACFSVRSDAGLSSAERDRFWRRSCRVRAADKAC